MTRIGSLPETWRYGLVGGLPALYLLADALGSVSGVDGPAWFRAVAGGVGVVASLLFTLLAFALAAVVGAVGVALGDWLSKKTGRRRSATVD
ncbi:hypothetical protein [Haloplanus natans]|uniref:hypothetical protein n=1 Tax=Haloplanus natans TaxID=376171 RepID=UPI000678242D|nr:hypothetical protein [Haloplanus natans]